MLVASGIAPGDHLQPRREYYESDWPAAQEAQIEVQASRPKNDVINYDLEPGRRERVGKHRSVAPAQEQLSLSLLGRLFTWLYQSAHHELGTDRGHSSASSRETVLLPAPGMPLTIVITAPL